LQRQVRSFTWHARSPITYQDAFCMKRKIPALVRMVLVTCALLASAACMDQDPFGLSRRKVAGPYRLQQWEDGQTYYLVGGPQAASSGGAIEGTVLRMGWSRDRIVVQRSAVFGGAIDWMVIDVGRREVSGPFTEAQIRGRADLAHLTLYSAADAWRKL
jgi:hypothetical protein